MSVKYARRPSRKEQTEIDIGSATPREIQAKHIVILTGHAEKNGQISLPRTQTATSNKILHKSNQVCAVL